MIGRKKDFGIRHRGSHPEGWARGNTTLKRVLAPVLQHSAMLGPRLSVGTTSAVLILVLSALPPVRLFAQGDLDRLALRFRSEEHTSELQSPCNLVCRLLLEKKKQKI